MDKLKTDTCTWLDKDEPVFTLLEAAKDEVPGVASPLGNVCLCGESQAGKTRLVNAFAERHGVDVLSVQAQLDQPEDIGGYPHRIEGTNRVEYTHPQIIPSEYLERNDWILFLDELDKAPEAVLSCLLTLLAERRIRHTKVTPMTVVAACNPPRRPLPNPLMARLLWVPYPPRDYNVLDRESLAGVKHLLEDTYPPVEPNLPELDMWYGSAHRLAAWYQVPEFWKPEIQKLVLYGSFPATKAEAIMHKLEEHAVVDGIAFARSCDASQLKSSLVPVLMSSTIPVRNEVMKLLQQRASFDATGELGRVLRAWCQSPAAQALTDATGRLGGLTIEEMRDQADTEMARLDKKFRKDEKDAEKESIPSV